MCVFNRATLKDHSPATYALTHAQVEAVDMSDPCFLIVHPRGPCRGETGLNDAVHNCPEGGGARHDKIDKSLKSQSAGSFRERQRLCGFNVDRAKERTRLYVWRQTPANIIPTEYAALKNSKAMLIDGDYDVSGDGSVTLISTPGHTPGHQSLLVKLPKTGQCFWPEIWA